MFGIPFAQRDPETLSTGTRFLLFPQAPFLSEITGPETIWVSSPAGSLGPGPSDDAMAVIDPAVRKLPYGLNHGRHGRPFLHLPPWDGPVHTPVEPGPDGHFDHLEPGTRAFAAAHAFGCVRFALDVWERYLGEPLVWHFADQLDRLEIVMIPHLDNATAGWGFLEVGSYHTDEGELLPHSLNFDILAHEVGHLLLFKLMGLPDGDGSGAYLGFHESAADLVALITAAHFDSVIDDLLEKTRGNLYVLSRLNRIAELSDHDQIRIASNDVHLDAFADGWKDEHDLSEPLTGAVFDTIVDIFHELLVERELISPEMEHFADIAEDSPEHADLIQELFDARYGADPAAFRETVLDARDLIGGCLAETWRRLEPDDLDYTDVMTALLDIDEETNDGAYARIVRRNFGLRGIGSTVIGPRLGPPAPDSHAASVRTLLPEVQVRLPRLSYRERWLLAHGA